MSSDDGNATGSNANSLTKQKKILIIEYWVRKLLLSSILIDELIQIMIEFATTLEMFDRDLIDPILTVDDEYQTVSSSAENPTSYNAFGSFIAIKGAKYHWRLKIEKDRFGNESDSNIGVVEADKANLSSGWWVEHWGYSYYNNGMIYSAILNGYSKEYAEPHESGDIIEIWLDLMDNFDLSFGRNGENYGKAFDMNQEKEYRLAVELDGGKVSILDFSVDE